MFSRRPAARRRPAAWLRGMVLAAGVAAVTGCAGPAGQVELAGGDGGDAWTFEKLLRAQVPADGCEAVRFVSPHGEATARPLGGEAMARVPLGTGSNRVSAFCADGGQAGGDSQQWEVRLAEGPRAQVRSVPSEAAGEDNGIRLDAGASRLSQTNPAPLVAFEWRARPGNPAPLAGLPASGRRITLPAPPRDGEYYVTLRVTDAAGRSDENTGVFRVRAGRAEAVDLARDHPDWVNRAVVYGVAPFFFGPRRLADVTARLDELAALGVNTLWLSPITAAAEGDFGYAVTDYFRLRADFGSEADLRALIAAAHARRMRVIMDFVPNHVADSHRYASDAEAQGRESPYFGFFERDAAGAPAYYFDWEHLINLDYDNPEVQRWVIEGFSWWVREFDVDGFRADAAWGPRRRAPEFWAKWRAELKRIKPDLLLLAEASTRDPYYVANGFDAAYDWTAQLGEWAWRDAFESEERTAALLRAALAASRPVEDSLVFRFMNNNDTGERFIERYGLARTRLAAVLLLTLPGLPMIYTGQEVGATFEPYDEGPVLDWQDRHGLAPWYRRLIALRAAQPALRSDEAELLDLPPADRVLAYRRPGGQHPRAADILVLQNWSPQPLAVTLPAQWSEALEADRQLVDLLSGERLAPTRSVSLQGYGARVIAAQP